MRLFDLLRDLSYFSSIPREQLMDLLVEDITYDSRRSKPNTVFVCLVGETVDGHSYAINAYSNGCRIFIAERPLVLPDDAVVVRIANARVALAKMSHAFFGHPQDHLTLIGITGTKGKTTIANLTMSVLNAVGLDTGCIGTNGVTYHGFTSPTKNTTPESYELARLFREMLDAGVRCVVMEVSSLGIKMHRTDEIHFDIGVFTNIAPDHIGPKEHPSFEDYLNCKARLFENCSYSILNADDPHLPQILPHVKGAFTTFSIDSPADLQASHIQKWQTPTRLGVEFMLQNHPVKVCSPGAFSVYNALAILAICNRLSIPEDRAVHTLSFATVKGRMEIVDILDDCTFILDYAHNELSFTSLLSTLRQYDCNRLVLLFGSVGGRSQMRRHALGKIAAQYCDFCILTSDNPDFEDPLAITHEIAQSFAGSSTPYIEIPDREEAVRYAVTHAQKGDMIVFTGKGHEQFQLIAGKEVAFSELETAKQAAKQSSKAR